MTKTRRRVSRKKKVAAFALWVVVWALDERNLPARHRIFEPTVLYDGLRIAASPCLPALKANTSGKADRTFASAATACGIANITKRSRPTRSASPCWAILIPRRCTCRWNRRTGFQLQQKSSAVQRFPGKQVEVINFGVSGYGTAQELLTLRQKVWDFSPDIVVLAFTTLQRCL